MRHKIELKSNNIVEYDSKQLGSKNTWIAPIVNSLHTLHPSIQSKYDDEVAEYEKLLNESKDLQIPLLIEIEKNISYGLKAIRFDLEEEISPLDLKLSKILQKPLNRISLSAAVFSTLVSKPSKRKQIKRHLFAEIGKGKEQTSLSKLYKVNKEKIFDCITLEFTPNSFNKGSLKLFSLLSKKGMAVISLPVREFSDIRKSLGKTVFNISALCSQRDCDFDPDLMDKTEKLINQKFNRPLYARYIVLVIARNKYDHIFIGPEFDRYDDSYYWDYFSESLENESFTSEIEKESWDVLPGFGVQLDNNDFYDLEHFYNQIKFYELKPHYDNHVRYELSAVGKSITSDIFNTYLYFNNLDKSTEKKELNTLSKYNNHDQLIWSQGKKLMEVALLKAKIHLKEVSQSSQVEKQIKKILGEMTNQQVDYEKFINDLRNYKPHKSLDKINNMILIEWRVDGARNCQFCGIFHPKDWEISDNKYWDPNYYIECIEIDTKTVEVDYLIMFYKTEMGRALIDIAIDNLNSEESPTPEFWRHIAFFAPNLSTQSQVVEAISSLNNLTQTLNESERSIASSIENIEDIVGDLKSWQSTLGLLNNSARIEFLISQGESDVLEFKESLSLDTKTKTKEKYIESGCLKTIVGFLNAKGGKLLVGVSDDGSITGISEELKLFYKNNQDKLLLHFNNIIKIRIGKAFYDFIGYEAIKIKGKTIIEVTTKAIKTGNGCYLDESSFYVRRNPGTDELTGKELVKYVQDHFK